MNTGTLTLVLSRIEILPNGCWLYRGPLDRYGYATINRPRINGHRPKLSVHRLSYEHWNGPIGDGLTLDHVCHNSDADCSGGQTCQHRACINPDHLEAVTNRENIRRGHRANRNKLTCRNGHPSDQSNNPDDNGYCRTCNREKARRYYWAHVEQERARKRI